MVITQAITNIGSGLFKVSVFVNEIPVNGVVLNDVVGNVVGNN